MRKIVISGVLVFGLSACNPTAPEHVTTFAPARIESSEAQYCPKDGSVYQVGSCQLDPTVMPSGFAEGTPVKYISGNWEGPADYPDPGEGNALTDCTTTDYHSCKSYQP